MNRPAAAALVALLTFAAASARAATRVSGTVLTTEVAADAPDAGSLTIVDKGGQTASYSVLGTTRVTRDGKKVEFDKALIGDLVVRAKFDPKTKKLTVLDLKSSGIVKPAATPAMTPTMTPAGPVNVRGEVAFADALKGALSVRTLTGGTRDFTVGESTKILRETAGKPNQEIGFENVAVGDLIEVNSRDGKSADQIIIRPAAH